MISHGTTYPKSARAEQPPDNYATLVFAQELLGSWCVIFNFVYRWSGSEASVPTNGDQAPFNLRKRLGLRSRSAADESENRNPSGEVRLASDASLMVPGQAGPSMTLDVHRSASVSSSDSKSRRRSRSPIVPSTRDPLGLHLIHRPENAVPKADIVFIHGLGGTSRSTWSKNRDPNLFWPLMFLPLEQDICNMRIFTYGYNAEVMKAGGRSSTSILDFAKNLLYDMRFFIDDAAVDLNIGKASITSFQIPIMRRTQLTATKLSSRSYL